MDGLIGHQLGNYRLVRKIGVGGFATVYLGEHVHLGTQAAIKILQTQLESADVHSFLQEARTVAHLRHPNIIRVLDFGVQDATPFLVLDYASGGSLRQQHPRGTILPFPRILAYSKQIGSALQYAHEQRIVHRDVKPENAFLGHNGEVLLGDFGTAFIVHNTLGQQPHNLAGTVAYMAPEQINGYPKEASDQYALGIIIYEWLCGERPFSGTFSEVATRHLLVPPPSPREKRAIIPPEIEQIVLTALNKEPDQRFPSIQEFIAALEEISVTAHLSEATSQFFTGALSGRTDSGRSSVISAQQSSLSPEATALRPGGSNATPRVFVSGEAYFPVSGERVITEKPQPTTRRAMNRRALLAGVIGAGVSAGAAITLWALLRPGAEPQKKNGATEKAVVNSLGEDTFLIYTGHPKPVYTAAWSPDDSLIASGGADTQVQIWKAHNGQQLASYLKHEGSVNTLAWLPGRGRPYRIASAGADQTVHVWAPDQKEAILVYREHKANIRSLMWSPDGTRIASGDDQGFIHIWDSESGLRLRVLSEPSRIWSVAWSPDGKQLATGGDSGIATIWAMDGKILFSYKAHLQSRASSHFVKALAWSPDGKYVASGSDDTTVHIWTPVSTSTYKPLVFTGHKEVLNALSWSPDGKSIASGGGDFTVQVWDAISGRVMYTYREHQYALHSVGWSTDGKRLLSCSDDQTVRIWRFVVG